MSASSEMRTGTEEILPIRIRGLHKSYHGESAVHDVSLDLRRGEIFGLIGPDGAGKTTILRILVTLIDADKGEVWFQGKDIRKNAAFVRSHIGYMPQQFSLYKDLTVNQNLRFFGNLFQVPRGEQESRIERLYQFSKLGPFAGRRAGALSGGMKQKLALSCCLMHEPEIIVLDEPTFGVDPVSRNEFWGILKELSARGISILVTTAYMDEAVQCHRVGLIHEGRILAMESPARLLRQFNHPLFTIRTDHPHAAYTALRSQGYGDDIQLFGNGVHFIDRKPVGKRGIKTLLDDLQIPYRNVTAQKPTLENLFLELMK